MEFRIRDFREEMRLTQGDLAKKAGISRATLSGLENGTVVVTTTETLIKIANALGKKGSDIFLE